MSSTCIPEASDVCCHGCCPNPFLGLPQPQAETCLTSTAASRNDFKLAMICSIHPNCRQFTNHESLPSLDESFSSFIKAFPQYLLTDQADEIREEEYLSLSNHVCFDYVGHGLFSYSQNQSQYQASSVASTSTSPPPSMVLSTASEIPSFDISHKSISLKSQLQYGCPESGLEDKIRKRIMAFMNISEDDYTVVFTANQSSAFKLLADSYPFQSHGNLLTVYDYENEGVKSMIESSKKAGARVMSAEFLWPSLRIPSRKLQKKVASKKKTKIKKKRGLFVFPLQSRMTGRRYPYFWMSMAEENGWHVVLDACALGPQEMGSLGLSLFKADFLICSFFKLFGEDPSGFGCLFVKKSTISVLMDSSAAASIGIVRLVPAKRPNELSDESSMADINIEPKENLKQKTSQQVVTQDIIVDDSILEGVSGKSSATNETGEVIVKPKTPEIEELEIPSESTQFKCNDDSLNGNTEPKFKSLDHVDSLGLVLIGTRARYLINWLVNALLSLQHPHSENGHPPVRIYGPKIKLNRGPAVAFNICDWKGEKIDPELVQKLADRHNISLCCGFLENILIPGRNEEEMRQKMEKRGRGRGGQAQNEKKERPDSGITVVTATLGFLTNFEDVYRLWAFVSRFLDADFVEKERWRYIALNQQTIEV